MTARPAAAVSEISDVADAVARILAAAPFVAFAYGCGSFFEGLPSHDVDVAIGLRPGPVPDLHELHGLAARCEAAVGRPVDLRVLGRPDTAFAASASGGRLLYAADPDAAAAFADLSLRMAWDFADLRERFLRDGLAAEGEVAARREPRRDRNQGPPAR